MDLSPQFFSYGGVCPGTTGSEVREQSQRGLYLWGVPTVQVPKIVLPGWAERWSGGEDTAGSSPFPLTLQVLV